jgi:hypothetical protein
MAMLAIAGLAYGKPVDEELEDLWAEALADVPSDLGVAALKAHIRKAKWFPTIAEIREGAEVARPPQLYLPPPPDPAKGPVVPREEIRRVVAEVTEKLKGAK